MGSIGDAARQNVEKVLCITWFCLMKFLYLVAVFPFNVTTAKLLKYVAQLKDSIHSLYLISSGKLAYHIIALALPVTSANPSSAS